MVPYERLGDVLAYKPQVLFGHVRSRKLSVPRSSSLSLSYCESFDPTHAGVLSSAEHSEFLRSDRTRALSICCDQIPAMSSEHTYKFDVKVGPFAHTTRVYLIVLGDCSFRGV